MCVAVHQRQIVGEVLLESDSLRAHRGSNRIDRRANDGSNLGRLHRERHLAGDDARDVQHLLDQPNLRFCVALDDLDGVRAFGVEIARPQDAGPAENRVERCPQLMRQRAEELVFQPIRVVCLPIQTIAHAFGLLSVGNLDAQPRVRLFECDRPLFDSLFQLTVSLTQHFFIAAQRALRFDALGDVDGVAENVRTAVRTMRQDVSIHPYPCGAAASDDAHQSGVVSRLVNALQVSIKQMALVGGEKLAQIAADAILRSIT